MFKDSHSHPTPFRFALDRRIAVIACVYVFFAQAPTLTASLVQVEGLREVTAEEARRWLAPLLTAVEQRGVSRARADDLAYFLESALRDRGYGEATVDWRLVGSGEGQAILLTVSEGASPETARFAVSGNTVLEDDAVLELLTEATRKRLQLRADARVPYVPADLETGRRKLVEFYTLLGHNDARVALETGRSGAETLVTVVIDEGTPASVASITLPAAPTSELERTFRETAAEFENRSFNAVLVHNLRSRLLAAAVDSGYYEAAVDVVELSRRRGEGAAELVDLGAEIEWGTPVSVSGVTVRGNERVRDEFFARHFGDLVGAPYSPGETSQAVEQLLLTGAFETVRTVPSRQEDGSFLLDIEVEESHSRSLGVYGGFTNYDGAIGGFEFRHLNLFGMVRSVDSQIELSQRGAQGKINYTDPWFFDTDLRFGAGLFGQNRSEEGYDKWETGGNYELTKRFGRQNRTSASFFGRASYTEVRNASISADLLGETRYINHFVGLSLSHDRRDQATNPRRGFIAQTSASIASKALGSEVEYFKATGRLGYYLPVGEHTMRFGARSGVISPMGDTSAIPIDLRFYNGGPTTVRSFRERRLGPRDPVSGHPVGGEFYTVFNAEYEIPVRVLDGLSVVGFADAGNVEADAGDAGLDDLRYAVGVGLRYLTPIGPFRFEYGHNPDRRVGEPNGTFHLGFGFVY